MKESTFTKTYLNKLQHMPFTFAKTTHLLMATREQVLLQHWFLSINGIELDDPNEELYELMMKVANGRATKAEIATKFKGLRTKKKRKH